MANHCMMCGKKLGIFSTYTEDIFTGNTANCICSDCMETVDIILKKAEMKIPLTPDDFERFTDEGRKYIDDYLEADSVFEEEIDVIDPMECEVGDAVITRTFEVDDAEANSIFETLKTMSSEAIEEYLDPLVSGNDTADGFMREIKALNDEELKSVISDQRVYYNNAEWAYILFVEDFRKSLTEDAAAKAKKEEPLEEAVPETIDNSEIERMKEVFSDKSKEELEEIINDSGYTYEAHEAARSLLK